MQNSGDAAAAAAAVAHNQHRRQFLGLTAYDRHKRLMAEYVKFYGGKLPAPAEQPTLKTDYDILREQYRCKILSNVANYFRADHVHYSLYSSDGFKSLNGPAVGKKMHGDLAALSNFLLEASKLPASGA